MERKTDYEALGRYTEATEELFKANAEFRRQMEALRDELSRSLGHELEGGNFPSFDLAKIQAQLEVVAASYGQMTAACHEANIQAPKIGKPLIFRRTKSGKFAV
jgi:hypothetical protein